MIRKKVNGTPNSDIDIPNHELMIYGLQCDLFNQHWTSAFNVLDVALAQLDDTLFGRRKSEGEKKTWLSSVNKIELELEPNPMTLQLLESAQRKYKVNDIEVILVKDGFCTLLGAILAYVMQAAIPKATGISNTYFELQRTHVRNHLFKRVQLHPDRKQKHCEISGAAMKPEQLGLFIREDGTEVMAGWDLAKKLRLRRAFKWETQSIATVGMPVLGTCSCCVLRRPVRTEQESDLNIPPIPYRLAGKDCLDEVPSDVTLGSPIDHVKLSLTVGYKIVRRSKHGHLSFDNVRMCPSCVTVAQKHPKDYIRWMAELDQPWNRTVVKDRIKAWYKVWDSLGNKVFADYAKGSDRKELFEDPTPQDVIDNVGARVAAALEAGLELHAELPDMTHGVMDVIDGEPVLLGNIEDLETLLDEMGIEYAVGQGGEE